MWAVLHQPRETFMARDTITTKMVPIGSLAVDLVSAERRKLRAERELHELLDSLFASWTTYEHHEFVLDVYTADESDAARDALRRAGFIAIYLHDHAADSFAHCNCRSRWPT